LSFAEGAGKKIVDKLKKVLAFPEGAVKKVMASIKMWWHPKTEL